MSLLAGGIRSLFGSVFGALYLDGYLLRFTMDDNGKGKLTATPGAPIPVKVQIDSCTEIMRLAEGYTSKDVRLIILQYGVAGGDITADCRVIVEGVTYRCGSPITSDPARTYWEMRGTPK